VGGGGRRGGGGVGGGLGGGDGAGGGGPEGGGGASGGAMLRLFRQRASHKIVERLRQIGPRDADARRLLEQDLREHGHHVLAGERRLADQALVQQAAEREHVGARVDVAITFRLLGRHVTRRADHDAGARRR